MCKSLHILSVYAQSTQQLYDSLGQSLVVKAYLLGTVCKQTSYSKPQMQKIQELIFHVG